MCFPVAGNTASFFVLLTSREKKQEAGEQMTVIAAITSGITGTNCFHLCQECPTGQNNGNLSQIVLYQG